MAKRVKGKMAKSRIISSYSLDPVTYDRLKTILDREGKSINAFIKESAEEYIKAHETGNPQVILDKYIDDPGYVASPSLIEMENHNFNVHDDDDLGRYQVILVKSLEKVKHIRNKRKFEAGK